MQYLSYQFLCLLCPQIDIYKKFINPRNQENPVWFVLVFWMQGNSTKEFPAQKIALGNFQVLRKI